MAALIPFRALRPRSSDAAQVAAVPYDVVTPTRRGRWPTATRSVSCASRAPRSNCRRAPIPTRDAVYARARRTSRRLKDGRAGPRERAVAVLLPSADGTARADRPRRVLLARRIRPRRHQEARADAARQGRRPHAAHDRARRADGPVFLTYRGVQRGRLDGAPASSTAHRSTTSRPRRRAAHAVAGSGGRRPRALVAASTASRRCTSLTAITARRARRARARRRSSRTTRWATARSRHGARGRLSRTTRCRSFRTTASSKTSAGCRRRQFLDGASQSASPSTPGRRSPARRGEIAMYFEGEWRTLRPRAPAGLARRDRIARRQRAAGPSARADSRHRRRPHGQAHRLRRRRARHGRARAPRRRRPGGGRVLALPGQRRRPDGGRRTPAASCRPSRTWFEPKLRDGLLIHMI